MLKIRTLFTSRLLLSMCVLLSADIAIAATESAIKPTSDNIREIKPVKTSRLSIGAGVAGSYIADYMGSDEGRYYVLPIPYIYYQSDKVTVDRNAYEGDLFEGNQWHLALDAGGAIPVDSDKNKARKGMDDLDWVAEIGSSLEYYFDGNSRSTNRFYADLSIRKAFATDFTGLDDVGWTSSIALKHKYQLQSLVFGGRTTLDTSASVAFYSDKYAQYFYSVAESEATNERFAFDAKGGYAGTRLSIGASWRKNRIWAGLFTRYSYLGNTSFENSSLVKTKTNVLTGLAVSYIFMEK